MNVFSIDLSPNEVAVLRQSLDVITIPGKDAMFIATLQQKLEHELNEIGKALNAQEQQKQVELDAFIKAEAKKAAKAAAVQQ
jgi:CRISPR/Cas system-associated endoribonuclease Cas2